MSQFKFFHNDWIDVKPFIDLDYTPDYKNVGICELNINLDADFFNDLALDTDSLKSYRIDAARHCYETLGSKPALCFSGGIDSQATWQCFNEANIDIDVYILAFKNGLNSQDVEHAIEFAKQKNFKLNIIDIDIINFLARENIDYCIKYKSLSPHFNTHYKLCDILKSHGYTGFVCGGMAPMLLNSIDDPEYFCGNYSQNIINYINYSVYSGNFLQGNFLGYYPKLAWAISLLTPIFVHEEFYKRQSKFSLDNFLPQVTRDAIEYQRYLDKIQGYKSVGFNVVPQLKKYTGFELVKKELEMIYKDGWMFEKLYRAPLAQYVKEFKIVYSAKPSVVDAFKELDIKQS